ncbi:hypothetical protein Tco_0667143 [Tanacetum coccineum]
MSTLVNTSSTEIQCIQFNGMLVPKRSTDAWTRIIISGIRVFYDTDTISNGEYLRNSAHEEAETYTTGQQRQTEFLAEKEAIFIDFDWCSLQDEASDRLRRHGLKRLNEQEIGRDITVKMAKTRRSHMRNQVLTDTPLEQVQNHDDMLLLQNQTDELEKYTALIDLRIIDACVSRYLKDVNARTRSLEISGYVRFGNDQFAPILGYGDLIQGNVTIERVYYVEGLNHNLFSVGQFCDADLEDETPEVVKTFHDDSTQSSAQVITVVLQRHGILDKNSLPISRRGIEHSKHLYPRNTEQNGVVERRTISIRKVRGNPIQASSNKTTACTDLKCVVRSHRRGILILKISFAPVARLKQFRIFVGPRCNKSASITMESKRRISLMSSEGRGLRCLPKALLIQIIRKSLLLRIAFLWIKQASKSWDTDELSNFADVKGFSKAEKHFWRIQFLGDKLVSGMSKETIMHCMYSAEAEYVALSDKLFTQGNVDEDTASKIMASNYKIYVVYCGLSCHSNLMQPSTTLSANKATSIPGGKNCASLRVLKPKCTIESRAKSQSKSVRTHSISTLVDTSSGSQDVIKSLRKMIIVIFAEHFFRVILFSIHNDEWKSFQCHHQTALRFYVAFASLPGRSSPMANPRLTDSQHSYPVSRDGGNTQENCQLSNNGSSTLRRDRNVQVRPRLNSAVGVRSTSRRTGRRVLTSGSTVDSNSVASADNSQLEPGIVEGLIHFLDAHNELVQLFRTARDKCRELNILEFKIRLYNAEGARGYELPTLNTLGAMVFENGISDIDGFLMSLFTKRPADDIK